jgi:hypothetical protein
VAIGLATAWLTRRLMATPSHRASDFTYSWEAAQAIRHHAEAYQWVASIPMPWGSMLFYPLTAGVLVLPLSWLDVLTAGAIFVGLGCALLAYTSTRDGEWWRLFLFASAPALQTCESVQWAPLLTAAVFWSPALLFTAAKPQFYLPLALAQSKPKALAVPVILGAAVLAVSLALEPSWPSHWLTTFRHPKAMQYHSPLFTPVGAFVALAACRWRRPEARLLLGMALVPQNPFFYDQLPLLVIAATPIELVTACVLSFGGYSMAVGASPDWSIEAARRSAAFFPYMVVSLYIPALLMVLRRPNEGAVPVWLESRVRRRPRTRDS